MQNIQDAPSKPPGKNALLRRALLALAAIALLAAVGKAFGPGDGDRKAQPTNPSKETGTASDHSHSPDGFDDLTMAHEYKTSVASQSHRVVTLEQEVTSLKRSIEDLRGQMTKAAAGQDTQFSRLDELTKLLQGMAANSRMNAPQPGMADPQAAPEGKTGVRLITFEAPPGRAVAPKRLIRIPSASAGEATLMNGVFAPTSGEPSPARFRLDAALVGPTRSRIPLENAFLIGKASGNANASRVHIELISFSYVKSSGESVEVPVRGYVEGDDGMEGIPGTYLYRVEDQLPLVVLGEGASGFANALAEGQTTTTVNPLGGAASIVSGNTLKFGGLKAAAGTSQKISDIFAERMREIHPAVWTSAFGRVKVVFLEGVTLQDFPVEELKDGQALPFRDLDLHR